MLHKNLPRSLLKGNSEKNPLNILVMHDYIFFSVLKIQKSSLIFTVFKIVSFETTKYFRMSFTSLKGVKLKLWDWELVSLKYQVSRQHLKIPIVLPGCEKQPGPKYWAGIGFLWIPGKWSTVFNNLIYFSLWAWPSVSRDYSCINLDMSWTAFK